MVETGNLNTINEKYPERGGWVVGNFVEESHLRHSKLCEVKWIHHPKGFTKPSGAKLERGERTLVILISGKLKLQFNNGDEATLSQEGDYLIFDAAKHQSEALKESHMVVVRWKEAEVVTRKVAEQ